MNEAYFVFVIVVLSIPVWLPLWAEWRDDRMLARQSRLRPKNDRGTDR